MKRHFAHISVILIFSWLGVLSAAGQTYQFDTIESCTVVARSPQTVVFDVRYYYTGNHGRSVFIGAEGCEGTHICDYLSCAPIRISKGRGVARVSVAVNKRATKRHASDSINFFLYQQGQTAFEKKTLVLKHRWDVHRRHIAHAQPLTEYAVCLNDVVLTARRDGRGLSISSGKTILAGSSEWRCSEIQPGVFSLARTSWKKRSWIIDTNTHQAYESKLRLRGFLRKNKKLPFKVESSRKRFVIRFGAGRMVYNVANKSSHLLAGGYELSNCPDWKTVSISPTVYHTQNPTWGQSFWSIDTANKKAYSSFRARFRHKGGRYRDLPHGVEVKYDQRYRRR